MVFEKKIGGIIKTERAIYDKSHVQSEIDRSKECKRIKANVGYYCTYWKNGKSSSYDMAWICFVKRKKSNILKRAILFWSTWKEKKGKTKGYLKKQVEALI